jgi:hypothetical protein
MACECDSVTKSLRKIEIWASLQFRIFLEEEVRTSSFSALGGLNKHSLS